MGRVLPSVGQMSPRLVPCNGCSTYKRAQDSSQPYLHHVDEAQCDLARACAAKTTGVRDNIRSDCCTPQRISPQIHWINCL